MIKQFYQKVLPSQGVYCVVAINKVGKITHLFAETLDLLVKHVEENRNKANIFVAPNSFKGHSRQAKYALYSRSFFVDLDVGPEDGKYPDKESAVNGLMEFVDKVELPPPYILDSGNGIHAYWAFGEDIPIEVWKPYAEKFKDFCLTNGLLIDRAVTADSARILRSPDTYNLKRSPAAHTSLLFDPEEQYDFDMFKDFLGEVDLSVQAVLAMAPKGIDPVFSEIQKLKHDNFETFFSDIAVKSLEGNGCNQIRHAILNAKTLQEPLWYAALSIARNCDDWETAIHDLSEDHPDYNHEATIRKAEQTVRKPQGCTEFDRHNPGGCDGCPFRGKVKNPLAIARRLKEHDPAPVPQKESVRAEADTQTLQTLPESLKPYYRGVNGGIYYLPPAKVDKEGKVEERAPIMIFEHDVYPVRRMWAAGHDGAILMMRCILPQDPQRDFALSLKEAYSTDKLRAILASNEAVFPPKMIDLVMDYISKWAQHMINVDKAENVRSQMGWTEQKDAFVIGEREVSISGRVSESPAAPSIRSIAKMFNPTGTYERWQHSAQMLNNPGFEMHAFGMLVGFGSPLMHLTSTSGGTISYTGRSGAGKSGAMYGALSIYGDPKQLSAFKATDNGLQQRAINLKNLPMGIDEASNKDPEELSELVYWMSQGKTKIRMQSSMNAERESSMIASTLCFITTNTPIYDSMMHLKASPDGEIARLIEFTLKPLTTSDELNTEIFDAFRKNYGHAGFVYAKHMFMVGEEHILKLIDKWAAKFDAAYGTDAVYRFYRNMVACCMAGGELAAEAGIVKYDLDRIARTVIQEMLCIRSDTVKINQVDYKELMSEYFLMHQASLLIVDGDRVLAEPRGNHLTMRVEVHTGKCYVVKKLLKEYLTELKVSTSEFEFTTKETGFMVESHVKKRMSASWAAGRDTPPVNAYAFKWNDIDAIIKDSRTKQALADA